MFCPESTGIMFNAPVGMNSYLWNISGNGTIVGSTSGASVNISGGTNHINPFTLNLTVINSNGCVSVCQKTVATDNTPPAFTIPTPLTKCVEGISNAAFNPVTFDINPNRPDYYLFVKGNTLLDLTGITSLCCALSDIQINWRIDFYGGVPGSISGTGQPSAYNSNIQFSGPGAGNNDINHTITYWITDCNGRTSATQTQNITIRSRPKVL